MSEENKTFNITYEFEADQEKIAERTDIESLSMHVDKLLELQKDIEASEEATKNLKKQYDKISSEVIPNILA